MWPRATVIFRLVLTKCWPRLLELTHIVASPPKLQVSAPLGTQFSLQTPLHLTRLIRIIPFPFPGFFCYGGPCGDCCRIWHICLVGPSNKSDSVQPLKQQRHHSQWGSIGRLKRNLWSPPVLVVTLTALLRGDQECWLFCHTQHRHHSQEMSRIPCNLPKTHGSDSENIAYNLLAMKSNPILFRHKLLF